MYESLNFQLSEIIERHGRSLELVKTFPDRHSLSICPFKGFIKDIKGSILTQMRHALENFYSLSCQCIEQLISLALIRPTIITSHIIELDFVNVIIIASIKSLELHDFISLRSTRSELFLFESLICAKVAHLLQILN
ncbi:Galactokinase [Frankliniella fusca]|uniref:Galactokinase n=1 Tax=Frankliniella fusca TaxID=407009 RepID=A0AAE1HAA7_9NEOP|nr:Galactokinase [Frankliniella fusca]